MSHAYPAPSKVPPELNALTERVIGAAIEVHKALGPGLLESLYDEALAIEFAHVGLKFERGAPVEYRYRGVPIGHGKLDFLVERQLVVELKSVEMFTRAHTAQVLTYMRMTGCQLGLLINFNVPVLKEGLKRLII